MERQKNPLQSFPDHNQNYWQLACIQAASIGLPEIIVGSQLSVTLGPISAIIAIVIGNMVLWMIGFTIISMAAPNKDNAIENVQRFLGTTGGFLAAVFLILSFLSWYILQINISIASIHAVTESNLNPLRLGAALGFLTALLSIGGIRFIKHFCVISLPLSILALIYLLFRLDTKFHITPSWNISLAGIISVIAINLSGTVNLPTFFRHSRSKADSYFALSLFVFFTILFQALSILIGFSDPSQILANSSSEIIVLIGFILLTLMSVNLVNIYFASAGWEMIVPQKNSTKEYVIVGLMGTMAYTFLQISKPMEFLEEMANNFIASLGMVLLLAFLVKIIVKHRPRPREKLVNITCWLFGGTAATILQIPKTSDPSHVLEIAVGASCILFLLLIFIEETIWATKKLLSKRSS